MIPDAPIPPSRARPADLSDDEFEELDRLLQRTPEPLSPLDAMMLDGFLCGLLVQPVAIDPQDALRWVFDEEGRPLPGGVDPAWLQRTTELIDKRRAALRRSIVEDRGFDPLVLDIDVLREAAGTAEEEGRAADASELDPNDASTFGPGTTEIRQALLPWVAGFGLGVERFPALLDLDDDAVSFALARVFRHLPAENDEQAEITATLDREMPLADLDDAIADLVDAVVELVELTEDARYRVEQVRRASPKVGRNDPCPCGSSKKFKLCHGRA